MHRRSLSTTCCRSQGYLLRSGSAREALLAAALEVERDERCFFRSSRASLPFVRYVTGRCCCRKQGPI